MELNYKKFGESGDNLIILHGLFGMLDNWTTLSKRFAETTTVYAVDQRNHGKSPHSDDAGYEFMARDLDLFMEQHGLYTANIIGHSMGGKTAMQFADMFPERVERLVIADIAPKEYDPKHSLIIEALQSLPISQIKSRDEAEQWLFTRINSLGVRQFLLKNLKRTKDGFAWKMNLPALINDYHSIIGSIEFENQFDRPVLAIRGGESDYINNSDEVNFRKIYSNFRLSSIPKAGHWVHAEQPDHFFELVTEFLEEPLF